MAIAMQRHQIDRPVEQGVPARWSGNVPRRARGLRGMRERSRYRTSGVPCTSAAVHPKVSSACGFQAVMVPSGSMPMNASLAVSRIMRLCSLCSRSISSLFFRAVMSLEMPAIPETCPLAVEHRDFGGRHQHRPPPGFLSCSIRSTWGWPELTISSSSQAPAEGVFGFEIVRVALPNALRGVFGSQSSRVRLVDSGEAGLAILEINQVGNIFHQGAQQFALLVHLLDQFEVNHGGATLAFSSRGSQGLAIYAKICPLLTASVSALMSAYPDIMTRVALETSLTRRRNSCPLTPGHALIAQDYRDVVLPRQRQSRLGVGGRKHLVIVFEKMFQRREDERFIIQDQQFFLHFALCNSRSSGILTMNSVPTPSSL